MVSRSTFERHVSLGERATRISCPDCAGVLGERVDGDRGHSMFVCRVGHTFSMRDLLVGKEEHLSRRTLVRVVEPVDGEPFEVGTIYVAPRDQHLLLEDGVVRLNRGPKEHRTRPAVDPLFRSAAEVYGERGVGVLLSGYGDDGVSGLIDIKKAGGLSIVQNPEEALHASMPCTAIRDDDVDAVLTLHDLAAAIVDLAKGDDGAVSQCDQR